jgi:hypothetical protein
MSRTARHIRRAKVKRKLISWEECYPYLPSKRRLGSDLHVGCNHCWDCAHWNGGTLGFARRRLRAQVRQAIRTEQYDKIPVGIAAGYQD